MMCEVMPTIYEDTLMSQSGSQSSGSESDTHFEQLLVNMLHERDRLLDTLRETQESLGLSQQSLEDVLYDRDSLQRQLNSALPQFKTVQVEIVGTDAITVENQAVEPEEMKEATNRAEKEEETLEKEVSDTEEIRQGQEVATASAPLRQSSRVQRCKLEFVEWFIREFEPDDETPDLEVTGEAGEEEEAGAHSVVAGQESVPVAGGAHYSLSCLCKLIMYRDSLVADFSDPSQAKLVDAIVAVQFLKDEFQVDLVCVVKSLLENSGDFQATRHYLHTGRRVDGRPLWTRHDDLALQSGDPATKQTLILKYGEEDVARRGAFFSA
ncbi:UNVERIFIED_CONTAM: hypothetical protein FKN15_069754 [Acipenser sinensis]